MTPFIDAYAVLGVATSASQAELKAAHRALVRRHHPDLAHPDQRAVATRRTQQINVAYGLVRTSGARATYDRVRRAELARHTGLQARTALRDADRAAAEQWEELVVAAGKWAGRWWVHNRRRAQRGALRARLAVLDAAARVLWLASCVLWAAIGLVCAASAQRFLDVEGPVTLLVGVAAGALVGSRRGWRRRLRLARLVVGAPNRAVPLIELLAGVIALAAGLGADVALAQVWHWGQW